MWGEGLTSLTGESGSLRLNCLYKHRFDESVRDERREMRLEISEQTWKGLALALKECDFEGTR